MTIRLTSATAQAGRQQDNILRLTRVTVIPNQTNIYRRNIYYYHVLTEISTQWYFERKLNQKEENGAQERHQQINKCAGINNKYCYPRGRVTTNAGGLKYAKLKY